MIPCSRGDADDVRQRYNDEGVRKLRHSWGCGETVQQEGGLAVQPDDGADVQQALWTPTDHLVAFRMKRERLAEHLHVWNEAGILSDWNVARDSDYIVENDCVAK